MDEYSNEEMAMQAKWIGLTTNKKNYAIALLIVMLTPLAHAAISCSDMDTSGPHYQERMEQIAKQANLPGGTYLRPHEQVVANYCHGNADANRELVQQRYVRQQDVSSIERLLQVENHANAKVENAHPTNESALIEELVNKMFIARSQQWFVDRYGARCSPV